MKKAEVVKKVNKINAFRNINYILCLYLTIVLKKMLIFLAFMRKVKKVQKRG